MAPGRTPLELRRVCGKWLAGCGRVAACQGRGSTRPLIRFRSGDIGRFVADKCACGRTLGRIYVDGRKDDMFIVSAVNVYPSDIEFVVRGLEGVTGEYLIRITEENFTARYEVTIERSNNNPEPDEHVAERPE